MTAQLKTTLTSLTLGLTYALLFFHAEMGLNLFLFDALVVGLALWMRPELARHKSFVWSVGGLLFAAGSVVIVHTDAAVFAHHLTYFLVLGFAQARELRFIWFGLLLSLEGMINAPIRWFNSQRLARRREHQDGPTALSWLKQAVIPALVVIPFLILYLSGNDKFARGLDTLLNFIDNLALSQDILWLTFLTIFGLFTLFRKVRDKLTLTYLLHTNGMAAWLCLLLFAAVNWTNVITRVNLATQTAEEVDWKHLRQLPDDNTFLLLHHPEAEVMNTRKSTTARYRCADWRSWNYSDWRNLRALQ